MLIYSAAVDAIEPAPQDDDAMTHADCRYILATTLVVAMMFGGTLEVQKAARELLLAHYATLLDTMRRRIDRARAWCEEAGAQRLFDMRSSNWRMQWTAEVPLAMSVRADMRLLQSLCEHHVKAYQVRQCVSGRVLSTTGLTAWLC